MEPDMHSKEDILDCIPAHEPGVTASDIFAKLGVTHYKHENARNAIRREIRNAVDRGEVVTNSKFELMRAPQEEGST
jgi:hypothetical protein